MQPIMKDRTRQIFSPLRGEKKRGGDTTLNSTKIALARSLRNGEVLEDVDCVLDFIWKVCRNKSGEGSPSP